MLCCFDEFMLPVIFALDALRLLLLSPCECRCAPLPQLSLRSFAAEVMPQPWISFSETERDFVGSDLTHRLSVFRLDLVTKICIEELRAAIDLDVHIAEGDVDTFGLGTTDLEDEVEHVL